MSTYSDYYSEIIDTKENVNYYDDITNHVSVEQMVQHMVEILEEYTKCLSMGNDAKINPFSGRVTMNINGINFEIPEKIQQLTIAEYMRQKKHMENNNQENTQINNDSNFKQKMENVDTDLKEKIMNNVYEYESSSTKVKITQFILIILIAIVLVAIYKQWKKSQK